MDLCLASLGRDEVVRRLGPEADSGKPSAEPAAPVEKSLDEEAKPKDAVEPKSETPTNIVVLANRLQKTPWDMESNPVSPKR